MSDDEFIYDDDDDWYWYEEDNMGLGDELAENAVHSPIMVEDPSLETVDTYSDWEYYSDDYYDDDPTIITKHKTNGEPRKKRRKLSSTENIPSLSLGSSIVDSSASMANSFKGVLWRVPVKTDDKIELYEPGKGEQVALLSDWRELFKTPIHVSNGAKADDFETNSDVKKEVSAVHANLPERLDLESSPGGKYGRYSPPPLTIENMDKTISRQREKLSRPELEIAPEDVPAETMVIADSEDEEELDETDETTIAIAEIDAVDDDEVNMLLSEKEDEPPHQPSIRVEIPTLAAAMKENDTLNQNTPPRKRGRKPKTATTEQVLDNGTKKAATAKTSINRGRKRALESDKEDEASSEDNRRRSRRVASSTITKATKGNELDKKRTRANSTASSREERGKKRRT